MRLCIFFTEQALHGSEHADAPGLSGIGAANLGECLGIPRNSQLSLLFSKRGTGGLSYQDAFNNPLLCIKEIDPDVQNKLIWHVAAALRHLVAGQVGTSFSAINNYIETAVTEVIGYSEPVARATSNVVAKALHEDGYLDPVALSTIFRNGDFQLFEAAIVQLTDIKIRLVRRLIFETGGVGLAVLVRAVGLSLDDALYIHNATIASSQRIFPESVNKTIAFQEVFSKISVDVAWAVCAHWKRGRKFQSAIWDVKTASNLLASER